MSICNVSTGGREGSKLWIEFNSDEELARAKLFYCYSESLLQFATACCIIFILVGVPGNLITIVALARYKKVWNATAVFIINLHTSNLIFCSLIIPMTAMTYVQRHWNHGWIMCRLYAYIKYMLTAVALFSVLAISLNRYFIVCHPLLYPKLYTRRNISIMLVMMWAAALILFLVPNFGTWGRYELFPKGGFCILAYDKNNRSPKAVLITVGVVGLYIIMIFCYSRIWWVVMQSKKKCQDRNVRTELYAHSQPSPIQSDVSTDDSSIPGRSPPNENLLTSPEEPKSMSKIQTPLRQTRIDVRPKTPTSKDKKLCAMIAAVMISFCICHLPMATIKLVSRIRETKPTNNIVILLFQFLNHCISPVIYVIISKEYRQAYRNLFKDLTKKLQRLYK